MTALEESLRQVQRLAVDSAPWIYLIEGHPEFAAPVRMIVERAEKGELKLCTSALTLIEVLALPLAVGAHAIAEAYETILLESPYLELHDVDRLVARRAADLRGRYRLKTPDAVQVAVALQAGCDAFLTNDRRLRRVQDLTILVLSDLCD